MPDGPHPDVNIRLPDAPMEQERRLLTLGLPAAQAYVRANGLDRIVTNPRDARVGIIVAGKSYHDASSGDGRSGPRRRRAIWRSTVEARNDMASRSVGDPRVRRRPRRDFRRRGEGAADRGAGARYPVRSGRAAPRVVGKRDETGAALLKAERRTVVRAEIGLALAQRIGRYVENDEMAARRAFLEAQALRLERTSIAAVRKPYYCSGCPHNTSTKVIDGSRALAGSAAITWRC